MQIQLPFSGNDSNTNNQQSNSDGSGKKNPISSTNFSNLGGGILLVLAVVFFSMIFSVFSDTKENISIEYNQQSDVPSKSRGKNVNTADAINLSNPISSGRTTEAPTPIKTFPATKGAPNRIWADEENERMILGYPTKEDTISKKNIIHIGNVAEQGYFILSSHDSLLKEFQKLSEKLSAKVNLSIVCFTKKDDQNYVHHFYFQKDRIISGFRNLSYISAKNLDELLNHIVSSSDSNTINLILSNDTKNITEKLKVKYDKGGKDFYIRNINCENDLAEKIKRIETLKETGFSIENLSIFDGLPENGNSPQISEFRISNPLAEITKLREKLNDIFQNNVKFKTKDMFFQELEEGTNDILFVCAHATKDYIYINNDKISLQELQNLPARKLTTNKPRVIVLFSCLSGDLNKKSGSFGNTAKSISEIFVEKNFADVVIAPNDLISTSDIVEAMSKIRAGETISSLRNINKKWSQIVKNNFLLKREPYNQPFYEFFNKPKQQES